MELVVISDFLSKVSKCFNFYIPLYIHSVSNFWAANESHYRMKSCCFFVFVLFFYMFDNKVCLLRANIFYILYYLQLSNLVQVFLGSIKMFHSKRQTVSLQICLNWPNLCKSIHNYKICQILPNSGIIFSRASQPNWLINWNAFM